MVETEKSALRNLYERFDVLVWFALASAGILAWWYFKRKK